MDLQVCIEQAKIDGWVCLFWSAVGWAILAIAWGWYFLRGRRLGEEAHQSVVFVVVMVTLVVIFAQTMVMTSGINRVANPEFFGQQIYEFETRRSK